MSSQPSTATPLAALGDKVAVITGANGGIGVALVQAFREAGARVLATDVDREPGASLACHVDDDVAVYLPADLTDPDAVTELVAGAERRFCGLDVFVGNAGTNVPGRAHSLSVGDYRRIMAVCTDANFHAVKAGVPAMRRRGGGVFILVSSTAAEQAMPNSVAYNMAKRALLGLVQSVAVDYGHESIRAMAILPGPTRTPLVDDLWGDELTDLLVSTTATKRLADPHEQARVAVFLASDDSQSLNGSWISVDGGSLAGPIMLRDALDRATGTHTGTPDRDGGRDAELSAYDGGQR